MRFFEKLNQIDLLVSEGCESFELLPTDEFGQNVLDAYFLDQIQDKRWMFVADAVRARGGRDLGFINQRFLAYLRRCPIDAISDLPLRVGNLDLKGWREWLSLAGSAIPEVRDAMLERFNSALPFGGCSFLADNVVELLKICLEHDQHDRAFQTIELLLRFHPDPKAGEKEKEFSDGQGFYIALEPAPLLESYQFENLLSSLIQNIPSALSLRLFSVLSDILNDAINLSVWPQERTARMGNDGSDIWRPSIEAHEQNHDFGNKEKCVSAIRDLGERILKECEQSLSDVLAVLDRFDWVIFRRIKLHLFWKFPGVAGTRIRDIILDRSIRDSHAWHEWTLLLKQGFRGLPPVDQSVILDWIDTGFDAAGRIEWFREHNDGRDPAPELVEQWKGFWQFGKLSLIADDLHGEWKHKYESLKERFQDPGHPEFHYWSEGGGFSGWEEASPVKPEEILSSSPEELVSRLESWTEDREMSEPTEWGLLSAVKSAVKSRPGDFLSRIDEYRALGVRRFEAVLVGCIDGAKDSDTIDWRILLRKIAESVRELIVPSAREEIAASKRSTAGLELARAIEGLLSRDPLVLSIAYREEIWDCIRELLNHPDPATDDGTSSPRDLSSTALNSCRLVAFGCVFKYIDWVRKGLDVTGPENPATEVLPILDERLRSEPTLAGLGMFGQYLPWLMGTHRDWVEEHLDELFPSDLELKSRRDAVWESFLTMTRPSGVGFDLLQSEYERAIQELTEPREDSEARREGWKPEESLVHHLCAFYWWGRIPLRAPGTLLARFFSIASVGLKRHMLKYMGRSLRSTEGDVSTEIQERFQEFMKFRLEVLGNEDTSRIDRAELRGFMKWVGSKQLPAKWTLETLLRVLELAPSSEVRDDFLVDDALAAYSEDEPDLATKCLNKLAFSGDRLPDWYNETPIRTVLRRGLASGDPAVKQMAEEVQDALLREGRLGYRDLGSDSQTSER